MLMDDTGCPALPASGTIERHVLQCEEELRLEVNFHAQVTVTLTLQKGSCELQGVELALSKKYTLAEGGGMKLALFTWHGCVIDVDCDNPSAMEISYTSDETNCNIAYVNTHAQLEALRDEAYTSGSGSTAVVGPRVLVCGPSESGKSSLVRILTAYACKLGRTPIVVDLDPADNGLSTPGTLAACPMDGPSLTVETYACNTMMPAPPMNDASTTTKNTTNASSSSSGNTTAATPLALWHGNVQIQSDLFKAQVNALGSKVQKRLEADAWARASGIIVNASIPDDAHQKELLYHIVQAMNISVVLVLGHDRLYSLMKSTIQKNQKQQNSDNETTTNSTTTTNKTKVIKVPRSGGVVSRDSQYLRQCRSRAVKRYFYGTMVEPIATAAEGSSTTTSGAGTTSASTTTSSAGTTTATTSTTSAADRIPSLTPFLLQISFDQLKIFKYSSISLSKSLLPVAAAQSTEAIQVQEVSWTEQLQHAVLAVCHPAAVAAYEESLAPNDLYAHGVAGFVAVERVLMDTEMVHLLAPCAGNLPSHTLILGENLTWME